MADETGQPGVPAAARGAAGGGKQGQASGTQANRGATAAGRRTTAGEPN